MSKSLLRNLYFFHFQIRMGTCHSPLPWISEQTPGEMLRNTPITHSAEIIQFCLWQGSPASWHMLSPRFPLFYPSVLSPFLIFPTLNSPGSCFSFRKICESTTVWPQAIKKKKTPLRKSSWLSGWNHLSDGHIICTDHPLREVGLCFTVSQGRPV